MTLVNAGGLLERTFTAGRYAMQLCAEAYRSWRFADEALPADLMKRCAVDSHSSLLCLPLIMLGLHELCEVSIMRT